MKLPTLYQKLEALVIFLSSSFLYFYLDFSLLIFGLLLFSVDIFMVGYLVNSKVGAHLYNFGHSFIIPSLLLVLGVMNNNKAIIAIGLIWTAHIGLDRALGYGLKFTNGFKHTHLGNISKKL